MPTSTAISSIPSNLEEDFSHILKTNKNLFRISFKKKMNCNYYLSISHLPVNKWSRYFLNNRQNEVNIFSLEQTCVKRFGFTRSDKIPVWIDDEFLVSVTLRQEIWISGFGKFYNLHQ